MSALVYTRATLVCLKLLRNNCKSLATLELRSVGTDAPAVTVTPEEEKRRNIANVSSSQTSDSPEKSFATMLRESKFFQMGCPVNNPYGALLLGTITHVVEDDLYIDFGGKFPCVCKRPREHHGLYGLGEKVHLRVHDLEMTSAFLGSDKHLTLLEADAVLLGMKKDNTNKAQIRKVSDDSDDFEDNNLIPSWQDEK